MASRVEMYLGSNSLQRPRSTARGSHILTFATQHVKESLKDLSPVGRTAGLQWVRGCVVLPICVRRLRWWYNHSFPLLVNTSRPSSSLD